MPDDNQAKLPPYSTRTCVVLNKYALVLSPDLVESPLV